MAVKHIPKDFHTITPYMLVEGASQLMDFIKKAFNAKEIHSMMTPDGKVMHAQLQIGDSMVMLADAREDFTPIQSSLYLYLPDTDAAYHSALKAGAVSIMEPADQFYGDRNAGVQDNWGNYWWLATHIEDVSQDEIVKRAKTAKKSA